MGNPPGGGCFRSMFERLFPKNIRTRKSPWGWSVLKYRKGIIRWNEFFTVFIPWSGFINPSVWMALFEKEPYQEKTPRLKCSKMPTRNNPLKWLKWVLCIFIGKRWVWKGGFPHLLAKAEISKGGGGETFGDDEILVSNFRFLPQI